MPRIIETAQTVDVVYPPVARPAPPRLASDKQISYILDLLAKHDHQTLIPGVNSRPLTLPLPDPLTAEMARDLIPWLKNRPIKQMVENHIAAIADAELGIADEEDTGLWTFQVGTVHPGAVAIGEVYKIVPNQEYTAMYAKILVGITAAEVDQGGRIVLNDFGKPLNPGSYEWKYDGGRKANELVRNGRRLTDEEAADFGRVTARCVRCGKVLTREESIDRGMGRKCAGLDD